MTGEDGEQNFFLGKCRRIWYTEKIKSVIGMEEQRMKQVPVMLYAEARHRKIPETAGAGYSFVFCPFPAGRELRNPVNFRTGCKK